MPVLYIIIIMVLGVTVSGDWRSFLRISGFPSCTSIYGKGGSSQSKVSSDGATSKESKVLIHSYPQCDRARWPNLLQVRPRGNV